jgi:hypothetical protein
LKVEVYSLPFEDFIRPILVSLIKCNNNHGQVRLSRQINYCTCRKNFFCLKSKTANAADILQHFKSEAKMFSFNLHLHLSPTTFVK